MSPWFKYLNVNFITSFASYREVPLKLKQIVLHTEERFTNMKAEYSLILLCCWQALETSLRAWEEKQRHQQSLLPSQSSLGGKLLLLSPFNEEEKQQLLGFIESVTTLVKWVTANSAGSNLNYITNKIICYNTYSAKMYMP